MKRARKWVVLLLAAALLAALAVGIRDMNRGLWKNAARRDIGPFAAQADGYGLNETTRGKNTRRIPGQ